MWIDMQPQDNKLTGLEERKRLSVDRRKNKRSHAIALLANLGRPHLLETRPSWRLFFIGKSRISFEGLRA